MSNNNFPPDGGGCTKLFLPSNSYLAFLRPNKPILVSNDTKIEEFKIKNPPSPQNFGPFRPSTEDNSLFMKKNTSKTNLKPENNSNVEFLG